MCKSLPSLEVISSPMTGARGIGIALTSSNGLRGSLGAAPPSSFTLRASKAPIPIMPTLPCRREQVNSREPGRVVEAERAKLSRRRKESFTGLRRSEWQWAHLRVFATDSRPEAKEDGTDPQCNPRCL